MIDTNFLKTAASLFFAVALIAGCSSTQEQDSGADTSADDSAQVDSVDTSGVDSEGVDDGVSLETVFYFDFDKSELRPDVRAALDAQAEVLRNKSGIVRLEGHTDERGTREYNMALGERRAKAVANYLAIQGVPRSQIETISYGEEKPVALGSNEEAWAQNRRVELVYVD